MDASAASATLPPPPSPPLQPPPPQAQPPVSTAAPRRAPKRIRDDEESDASSQSSSAASSGMSDAEARQMLGKRLKLYWSGNRIWLKGEIVRFQSVSAASGCTRCSTMTGTWRSTTSAKAAGRGGCGCRGAGEPAFCEL